MKTCAGESGLKLFKISADLTCSLNLLPLLSFPPVFNISCGVCKGQRLFHLFLSEFHL